MKIAVVGCGAVGSYYGAKLAATGHETHFLLRSDYESVRRQGVLIHSPDGDFRVHPRCATAPEQIGPCDLILIALKTTANDQLARLLPPLVGRTTIILTLQNGLGNEEELARIFPAEQIMGGLCVVCLNRVAPGIIHHIGEGRVMLAEFRRPPEPRTREIAGLFIKAGVPSEVSESLDGLHWKKLVWNIPFNGLGVAGLVGYDALTADTPIEARAACVASPKCLTTEELLGDARWISLVRELMLEVIAANRAMGFALGDDFVDEQIALTRSLRDYKASTLIDFERGQPLELRSMFLEPLRRARQKGLPMKRLSALCAVLAALDQSRIAHNSRGG